MSVSGLTGPAVLWPITATSTAGPVRPVPDKYAFQVPDKKNKGTNREPGWHRHHVKSPICGGRQHQRTTKVTLNTAPAIFTHDTTSSSSSFFLYEVACAPFTYHCWGRPHGLAKARPQGWDKCSVARHHQACLTVCVKCRCCVTSLFLSQWTPSVRLPAAWSEATRDRGVYNG